MNAVEIEEAISALAEQPFDGAEFPYAFLAAFGNKVTTIQRLRTGAAQALACAAHQGGSACDSEVHLLFPFRPQSNLAVTSPKGQKRERTVLPRAAGPGCIKSRFPFPVSPPACPRSTPPASSTPPPRSR